MNADSVAVYMTSSTGTTHLVPVERIATMNQPTTLCGRTVRWYMWGEGDETTSGIAASCHRCRSIFRPTQIEQQPEDDLTDPGGEAYGEVCPWWDQIEMIDRWNDGSLHCSKCGRLTAVIDGKRQHAVTP